MDKHEDKWVELMREKLEDYSPSYDPAHWSSLAGKMAAGSGGHGWFLSKLLPYSKILLISSVAVITTVVSILYVNRKDTDLKNEEYSQEMVETTEQGKLDNRKQHQTAHIETKAEKAQAKEPGRDVNELNAQFVSSAVQQDEQDIRGKGIDKNENKTSTIGDEGKKGRENERSDTGYQKKNGMLNDNVTYVEKVSGKIYLSEKLEHNSFEFRVPEGKDLASTAKTEVKEDVKVKLKKEVERPFYLGVFYSGGYMNNNDFYVNHYQNMFGVSAEKYLFRNFSISVTPRASFNSIKARSGMIKADSLQMSYFDVYSDSTQLPEVPVDSSGFYTGKLSYLDIPLILSYDIYTGSKFKLSVSTGIVSKYTFSVSKGTMTDELLQLKNKFTFSSTGLLLFRYNRRVSKSLYFEAEPFWEFPLDKNSALFSRSFFGMNLHLKFKIN